MNSVVIPRGHNWRWIGRSDKFKDYYKYTHGCDLPIVINMNTKSIMEGWL
jgi:hypothetical protein